MKLKNFGVRAPSNVAIFKVVTIGGTKGEVEKREKKTITKRQ